MANELVTKDKIDVLTDHGSCEIHLSYGSVTKLSKKEEVDVLVVSAFPNNYVETPWSVIGALRRDLGISVQDLANDKEEDLRTIFSCWWSRELPEDKSIRRILCFEGSYKPGARSTTVIGEIFRCLVSLSKGTEIKVMMPLISTGHQGCEYETILSLIVEAAIHWMEIGLLLRVLKIVVYVKDMKQIQSDFLLKKFRLLKDQWLKEKESRKKLKKAHPVRYDVYLSYCPSDQQLAAGIIGKLESLYEDISIYAERQEINQDKTWQDHIYEVMVSCARIITVLNPNFLTDEACLEQYNIALCCSRNMKRDYLAPLYVETVDKMPTYMSLIQYIDCRPFSDDLLRNACSVVTDWLKLNITALRHSHPDNSYQKPQPVSLTGDRYDVFISYSHKNSEAAAQIKKHLSVLYPDWKIFIDVSDLKTGVVWQTKLYNSIERSKVVVCLISPSYVTSKVCQEEYNLAMALHCDPAYSTTLFPILVEPVPTLPSWCSDYSPLDLTRDDISEFLELDGLRKPNPLLLSKLTEDWRTKFVLNGYPYLPKLASGAKNEICLSPDHDNTTPYIVLCHHHSDKSAADFLAKRLTVYLKKPIIQRPKQSEACNALIDKADLVIVMLSAAFVSNPKLIEEANIALCRQRWSDRLILLPVLLEPLPDFPAYSKLFLCFFSLTDYIWQNNKLSLKDRLSWMCTLNSAKAVFLDKVAFFASSIASNHSVAEGQFKTLISVQELGKSIKQMSESSSCDEWSCNPLVFQDAQLPSTTAHSAEKLPTASHSS
eukprot:gene776-10504_t